MLECSQRPYVFALFFPHTKLLVYKWKFGWTVLKVCSIMKNRLLHLNNSQEYLYVHTCAVITWIQLMSVCLNPEYGVPPKTHRPSKLQSVNTSQCTLDSTLLLTCDESGNQSGPRWTVSHNCFYYTSKPECAIPDDNAGGEYMKHLWLTAKSLCTWDSALTPLVSHKCFYYTSKTECTIPDDKTPQHVVRLQATFTL